jgi:hypothetical protein
VSNDDSQTRGFTNNGAISSTASRYKVLRASSCAFLINGRQEDDI